MSIMDALPNEITIEILSYLPYWDLVRHIPLVSRTFYSIINSASRKGPLDIALFRDHYDPELAKDFDEDDANESDPSLGVNVKAFAPTSRKFHPIFGPFITQATCFKLPRTPLDIATLQLPVFNENAVSPAVTSLTLMPNSSGPVNIEGTNEERGNTITVGDVINAIAQHEMKHVGEKRLVPMLRPVLLFQQRVGGQAFDVSVGLTNAYSDHLKQNLRFWFLVEVEEFGVCSDNRLTVKVECTYLTPRSGFGR